MADALKDQGNKAFQARDYDKAIDLFTEALKLDPQNFVLYSNRSAAKAGKRDWTAALADAEEVNSIAVLASLACLKDCLRSALKSIRRGRRATHARVLRCMASVVTTRQLLHMRVV